MGLDGGTIPTRGELVQMKKKPEQKDKNADNIHKWNNCSISQQPLIPPILACHLGTFCLLWGCGCVLSERALKEVPATTCHKCGLHFDKSDIVILNPNDDELDLLREGIPARRMKKCIKPKGVPGVVGQLQLVRSAEKSVEQSTSSSATQGETLTTEITSQSTKESKHKRKRDKHSPTEYIPKHSKHKRHHSSDNRKTERRRDNSKEKKSHKKKKSDKKTEVLRLHPGWDAIIPNRH